MVMKKYYYDENFFNEIDSEEKAYFLGLLYADGYVNDKGYRSDIVLTLKIDDEYILEKFLNVLKSNRKPYRYKLNDGEYSKIIINSKKMINDLKKYGCVNNKTHILKFPNNISYDYIHHMIRGYFDGDGSISGGIITFTGNVEFLVGIENFILEHLNIKKKLHYSPCNGNRVNNIRALKYGGNRIVTNIFDLLYKDSSIFLERKYAKLNSIKNSEKNINHVIEYNGIIYDSYNKGKLIDLIVETTTSFTRKSISNKLIYGWSVDEIINNNRKILI